jgi:hypothetical protein
MLLGMTAPAAAQAQTFYAAPNTSNTTGCTTPQTACEIHYAIGTAPQANGDEVVVLPGTYDAGTTSLIANKAISIHGEAGHPRPKIDGSTLVDSNDAALLQLEGGTGTSVSDLKLVENGNNGPPVGVFDQAGGARLDRLFVEMGAGASGAAVVLGNGTFLSDSVGWAPKGIGVSMGANGAARVENVTAYGVVGISANNFSSGSTSITVENSIARGSNFGLLTDTVAGGSSSISIGYSNFNSQSGTIDTSEGNNQSQDPALANPSAGDFHETDSSSTVDAGTTGGFLGSRDLAGRPRILGKGPDMGAYELPVLVVRSGAALASGRRAKLKGSVNPEGAAVTSCFFQYGRTTRYGSTVPCAQSVGSGHAAVPVSAKVTRLAPGSIYHYRLVATGTGGTQRGADRQFQATPLPALVSSPKMIGSGKAGSKLACRHGMWTGHPNFAYSWLRDGQRIPRAHGSSYTVGKKDVGRALQCQVAARNASGTVLALSNAMAGRSG